MSRPLCPAISWLDTRSAEESEQIKQAFTEDGAYQVTGQPFNTPTWPITKLLWLSRHEKMIFSRAAHDLLLKDYIQYCLTGEMLGEYSIYNFSYYFDLAKKAYWQDMLDFCEIRRNQLPDLVEPCSIIGTLRAEIAVRLGLDKTTQVNCGTLDHFAGMIGAVTTGVCPDYETAVARAVAFKETYKPQPDNHYDEQLQLYDTLYEQLQPVFRLDDALGSRKGSHAVFSEC